MGKKKNKSKRKYDNKKLNSKKINEENKEVVEKKDYILEIRTLFKNMCEQVCITIRTLFWIVFYELLLLLFITLPSNLKDFGKIINYVSYLGIIITVFAIVKTIKMFRKRNDTTKYGGNFINGTFILVMLIIVKILLFNEISIFELKSTEFMTILFVFVTSIYEIFKYSFEENSNTEKNNTKFMDKLKNCKRTLFKEIGDFKITFSKEKDRKFRMNFLIEKLLKIKNNSELRKYISIIYNTIWIVLICLIINQRSILIDVIITFGKIPIEYFNGYPKMYFLIEIQAVIWYIKLFYKLAKGQFHKI